MSKKTLSTGTLSLRFMQNAHRAKSLAEVEPDRAEVHDDGKWEVGDEVKRAWGMAVVPKQQTVTYEASYLPFLFPTDTLDSTFHGTKLKGRRSFKGGREVIEETPPEPDVHAETEDRADKNAGPSSSFKKPISISSIVAASRGSKPKSTKTAREMVHSISDVGTDYRTGRRYGKDTQRSDPKPSLSSLDEGPAADRPPPSVLDPLLSDTFLKPSGVDEPPNVKQRNAIPPDHDKKNKTFSKRERDGVTDPGHSASKKPKKKSRQE